MHAQNSAGALMRTGLAATPQQDTAQHRSSVSPRCAYDHHTEQGDVLLGDHCIGARVQQ